MRILREKRLNQELINGVSLQELYEYNVNLKETLLDSDRLLQAIDVQKDINILLEWLFKDEQLKKDNNG